MDKKILIAVAWPYVNGDIHVGHLAGYLLPADIFARYQRLIGNDVLMVSGSDCHGTPITVEAEKTNRTPGEVVDFYHKRDIELFKQYNFSYNLYTKTTTNNHKCVTQELFLQLLKNDFIVKDVMKQYYSEEDKVFLSDRYVVGTCVHCNAPEQRSDQCENCGRWLGDGELFNPVSKATGAKVTYKDTEHYFLDLEKLSPKLRKYIDSKKGIWRNWIWKEADGWLREGLKKRAITRDLDWGIELPINDISKLSKEKQLSSYKNKKIYVWFEAVIGYLSASQEWTEISKENHGTIYNKYPGQSNNWKNWWMNKDSKHYYFMGQDNLVFHTLMWQAELIGTKVGYTLPDNVVVNKFMNYEGRKFSKSRDWTIDSKNIAEEFGVDVVRFYIAANLPENKSSNFIWENFQEVVNNELIANLGNFINRTLVFLQKNFDGKSQGEVKMINSVVKEKIENTFKDTSNLLTNANEIEALNKIMELSSFGNKYFNDTEIWKVIKTDQKEATRIIFNLIQIIISLSILIEPFIPSSSELLRELLELEKVNPEVSRNYWGFNIITKIKLSREVKPLFKKIEDEDIEKFKLQNAMTSNSKL